MSRKFTYDYYEIDVPTDAVDRRDPNARRLLAELAIANARENVKLFAAPCWWEAHWICGRLKDSTMTFQVSRKRCKK